MGGVLTMKRKSELVVLVWLLVALLAVMIWVSGCATSPKQQWYTGQSVYNASLDVLITARAAGYISDKDYIRIEGYRALADASLAGMHKSVADGNLDLFKSHASAYKGALDHLIREAALADKETKKAAKDKKKLNAISEEG